MRQEGCILEKASHCNARNKTKTVLKSVEDSSVENKSNALKTLDIAYSKGIITKNFRDRNKSKISKL